MEVRTARETALLLAVLYRRSAQQRIRITDADMSALSCRKNLGDDFLINVSSSMLSVYSLVLVVLEGGYGIAGNLDFSNSQYVYPKTVNELSKIEAVQATEWSTLKDEALREPVPTSWFDEILTWVREAVRGDVCKRY